MRAGDVLIDRFELEGEAVTGGMGSVWRARDRITGDLVAIKLLRGENDAAAKRFLREARLLAELRHPAIVRYVAHGTTAAGDAFLAMHWLHGEDLRQRLARAGLTAAESVRVVRRAADALAQVHARGIVHRDVKPSNLFLVNGDVDRVTIIDFGVARVDNLSYAAPTMTGVLVGTPGYMAPEQARGERNVDARVDVFALGCVLFACLTGRHAFSGDNVVAVLSKILFEDPPRIKDVRPGVPEALDALVSRMLSKERRDRPRDAAEVVAELDALLAAPLDDTQHAPVRAHAAAITDSEQRFVSVVVCARAPSTREDLPTSAAAAPDLGDGAGVDSARLEDVVAPFGAAIERLMDGTAVATLIGRGSATDQAAQAARCALALRRRVAGAPIVLATGRGVVSASGRMPVGEVIDRATGMLRRGPEPPRAAGVVAIDELTAGLLDARFDVAGDSTGLYLKSERDAAEGSGTRRLLGKPTPCVGRERELALAVGLFDECASEPRARALLVTAPAGMGKSRFLNELFARTRGPQVWLGHADTIAAGSPFAALGEAIRRASGIREGEPLEVRRKKLRGRVARHVAEGERGRVAQFVGEMIGVPFDDADASDADAVRLRAARGDARLMSDQMLRALEDLVRAETSVEPLVIAIEDMQWSDLPTVKALDALLRALDDRPLMVVGLARPEVHDLFPRVWAERGVHELKLSELSRGASEKLALAVLGKDAPADVVSKVVERAAGNAFYLEELVRAVAEGKGDAFPETVLAMVETRLEGFESEARRVLRAASVFGRVFWRGGVGALLGGGEGGEWIDVLVDREVFVPRSESRYADEDELTFRSALVGDAAYAMLTDRDRALGHRIAAEWLTAQGEADAVVLAQHFERAGDPARALGCYRRAAEQALGANDLEGAIARADAALRCGAEGEVAAALRVVQAEAHRWRGEHAAARRCAEDAMAKAPVGDALWYLAAAELTGAYVRLTRLDDAVAVGARVREAMQNGGLGPRHVTAIARLVQLLAFEGALEPARALIGALDASAQEAAAAQPSAAARLELARGTLSLFAGDVGAALRYRESALACFDRAGDQRMRMLGVQAVANTLIRLGDFARSEELLREAIALAQRMGAKYAKAAMINNLGLALAYLGRLEEARALETEARDMLAAQGDRRLAGGSEIRLAIIALEAGDPAEAERAARRADAMLPEVSPLRAHAHAMLARALVALGRGAEALEYARGAMASLDRGVEEGEGVMRLALAEALDAVGDRAAARVAIAAARARLLERASGIDDPRLRTTFLEALPHHARTSELARAWGAA